MYEDANYYYEQGQQEVDEKKKPSILTMALFLALLDQPNYSGFNWKQYIEATIQYNAQQIYKQAIINMQQQKDLEIDSDEFQTIINRQNNKKININNNKISGAVDLQMIGLNNLAKVEGIKKVSEDNSKVRFIAVEDEKTTLMCDSLNNQEFYINKENIFDRYYGENQKELRLQRIRCNGLVLGLNLPPIQHHFHYCRSTIMYLHYDSIETDDSEDEDLLKYLDINNFIKKDITKQKNILIKQAFKNDMIKNIALNNNIKKIYIYGQKSMHKANKIYLNVKWKKVNQNKKDRTIRHEVGHAIDYKYNHISCGGELITALEIDKLKILKYGDIINKKLKSKKYEEYAELSDIIGGLTNNKIRGKYKHDNEYWKRKNALEKETFADLFAIAGGNDVKYLQVINKYLPNTLKAFDGIIGRIK